MQWLQASTHERNVTAELRLRSERQGFVRTGFGLLPLERFLNCILGTSALSKHLQKVQKRSFSALFPAGSRPQDGWVQLVNYVVEGFSCPFCSHSGSYPRGRPVGAYRFTSHL